MSGKIILLLFFYCLGFELEALSLDTILRADNAASLKRHVKKQNQRDFLKILCEKQKSQKKVPMACYELSLSADPWCLKLRLNDLEFESVEKALKSPFLSSICRKHLNNKKKILIYREKDFLLPELKNYWTVQKAFF